MPFLAVEDCFMANSARLIAFGAKVDAGWEHRAGCVAVVYLGGHSKLAMDHIGVCQERQMETHKAKATDPSFLYLCARPSPAPTGTWAPTMPWPP